MKLRCKLNDLAFIIRAMNEANIGRIVLCKEYLGYFQKDEPVMYSGEKWAAWDTGHIWVVFSESGLTTMYGNSKIALMMDHWMIPIDANKDELLDETEVKTDVESGLELIN